MKVIESIGETYADAVVGALPAHRLLLFCAALIGSMAVSENSNVSVLSSLSRIRLQELFMLKTGILAKATLSDIFYSISVVALGWLTSALLLRIIFAVAARVISFKQKIRDVLSEGKDYVSAPLEDRQIAIAIIDTSLSAPRSRIQRINTWAEISACIAMGLCMASRKTEMQDLWIGISFLLIALIIHVQGVRVFLSEYLGPALLMSQLQGKRPPTPFT